MQKLVLMSLMVVTVVVPVIAAGERDPRFALRKAVWWMLAGIAAYVAALLLIYPRLL